MRHIARGVAALCAAALPLLLHATEFGPPARYTGGPGDLGNCTSCHGGINNLGEGGITLSFSSGSTYTPGSGPITITLLLTDTNSSGGFQMSARLGSSPASGQVGRFTAGTGSIVICGDGSQRINECPAQASLEFIEHFAPRLTKTWTFLWTPPATNVGTVRFYAAASAVNGNHLADNNDHAYTTLYELTPAVTGPTPENALMLSQLVGGGSEWNTTLFITNVSDAAENFNLHFYDDAGNPKPMPMEVAGGTVNGISGTLAPGETRAYQTGQAPALQVAWALLVPGTPGADRLSGLAVFRQTVPSGSGTESSEAVVDFVPANASKYVMLYDNLNGFATTAMLANPDGENPVTILANIRDPGGAVLGTDQIVLPPHGHTAFVVSERFPLTAGRRGSIRLTASPGGFAGVGLRFSPFQTFTSFRLLTTKDIQ